MLSFLKSFARDGDIYQRLGFDLDNNGKRRFTSGWGVRKARSKATTLRLAHCELEIDNGRCRDAAVNGVSFLEAGSHHSLAVATGSRSYPDEEESEDVTLKMRQGLLQLYFIKRR